MKIESQSFKQGESIPSKFTCQGTDVSPGLLISDLPAQTQSLALIVDDPDAPAGLWVHWLLWNITNQTKEILENTVPAFAVQGKNSWGRSKYNGPCPPSGTHRYFFKLYALDIKLSITSSANKDQLENAMKGHIIATAELMGTYKKN
jgi:Raf kinase inhibitor-like YbhB/YbcL family protein